MRITPIDIQQQQFGSKLVGGYNPEEVDRFLEQVAEEIEQLTAENNQMREELARARGILDDLKERESTLKETLLTTQKVTDDLKANARREAELVVDEARMRADRILHEAEEKRLQVLAEIQTLRRQQIAFETSLRTAITSHLRLLDMGIESLPEAAAPAPPRHEDPPQAVDADAFDPRRLF